MNYLGYFACFWAVAAGVSCVAKSLRRDRRWEAYIEEGLMIGWLILAVLCLR